MRAQALVVVAMGFLLWWLLCWSTGSEVCAAINGAMARGLWRAQAGIVVVRGGVPWHVVSSLTRDGASCSLPLAGGFLTGRPEKPSFVVLRFFSTYQVILSSLIMIYAMSGASFSCAWILGFLFLLFYFWDL